MAHFPVNSDTKRGFSQSFYRKHEWLEYSGNEWNRIIAKESMEQYSSGLRAIYKGVHN